jgi:uncharacterized small protein (DUF1192 family)
MFGGRLAPMVASTVGWELVSRSKTIDKPSEFARLLFAFVAGFCIWEKLGPLPNHAPCLGANMSNDNSLSLPELNDRIAILEANIRQLVQQAAGSSGARDEERISDRIAQQNEQLERLIKVRDALLNK